MYRKLYNSIHDFMDPLSCLNIVYISKHIAINSDHLDNYENVTFAQVSMNRQRGGRGEGGTSTPKIQEIL